MASPPPCGTPWSAVAAHKARHPEAGRDAELRLGHHVLGAVLADMRVLDMTEIDFAAWRDGLRRGGLVRKVDVPTDKGEATPVEQPTKSPHHTVSLLRARKSAPYAVPLAALWRCRGM